MNKTLIHVLLIEDNPADILLLREMLGDDSLTSYDLTTVERLHSAIKLLQNDKFDIILLDLGLPDSQGLETFVRLHQTVPEIPVVILSGLVDESLAIQAVHAGAQDYLVKGIEGFTSTTRAIRYAIERQQVQETLRKNEALLSEAQRIGHIGHWEWTAPGKDVICSEELLHILEFPPDQPILTHAAIVKIIHPKDIDRLRELDCQTTTAQRDLDYEYRIILSGGRVRWLHQQAKVTYGETGQPVRMMGIIQDITERKHAEEILKASEERYRMMTEYVDDIVWQLDPELRFVYASPAVERVLGYSAGEAQGTQITKFLDNPGIIRMKEIIQARLEGKVDPGKPTEYKIKHKAGHWIDLEVLSSPINGADGHLIGFVGVARDITERKRAEEALRASEANYRILVETSESAIAVLDEQGKILYANPCGIQIWDDPSIVGKTIFDIYPREDAERYHQVIQQVIQKQVGLVDEIQSLIRDQLMWFRLSMQPIYNTDGTVNTLLLDALDITEKVEADIRLRESEARFRQLAENIQEVFWMFDPNTQKNIYASPAYQTILGISAENLSQNPYQFIDNILPEYRPMMMSLFEKQAQGEPTEIEYRIQHPDGAIRWVWDRSFPILDQAGQLVRTAGVATDITERKQAEQDIHDRQRLLENVIHLGKNITAITDLQVCLREIQRSITQGLGIDRAGLYLYDPLTHIAYGTYGTNRNGEVEDISDFAENIENWIAWQVALDNPMGIGVIHDYQALYHPPEGDEMYGIKQCAILAAWAGEKPVAMIAVDNVISQRVMTAMDLEALQLFAGYVGLAIENARLNASLEQRVRDRTTALRESEASLQNFLDTASDLIQRLDAQGNYIYVNPAWCNTLGYTAQEAYQMNMFDVVSPEYHEHCQRMLKDLSIIGQTKDFEIAFVTKNGEMIIVEGGVSIHSDVNGLQTTNGIFRNVTLRKQTESALRQSRDELRAANLTLEKAARLKDEFLANMSHELRTPLNSILAFSESLLEQYRGPLNEKQMTFVHNIDASGRHLLALINDILDLSKVEAGRLDIQFQTVALADVCEASLLFIKQVANKKALKLAFHLNDHLAIMETDPKRLKQMLVNLLSNAVKFTPTGGQVGLEVIVDNEAGVVRFTVQDTGIGIAPEDMARLFQPFTQLDSSLSRQHEGSGLGLALVRRLSELLGGSVTVESEAGQGSRFMVALPYQPSLHIKDHSREANPAKEDNFSTLVTEKSPDTLRILLAEDNEFNIQALGDYLQSQGYQIAVARNGREALSLAREIHPHLILMDIQMPEMDGLEAIRHLRASPAFATTPIIALTALAMPGDQEVCLAAGANVYMSKPVKLKELTVFVQQQLGHNHDQ